MPDHISVLTKTEKYANRKFERAALGVVLSEERSQGMGVLKKGYVKKQFDPHLNSEIEKRGSKWALDGPMKCRYVRKSLISLRGGGRGQVAPPVFKTYLVGHGGCSSVTRVRK